MNLFIDTISAPCFICIFDNKRDIIANISWDIVGNESSTLIPKLEEFLWNQSIWFDDLENIILVNGPGSFTWVRTAVLVVNTLNFILQKNMTALSYFDLFSEYPIIKSSSRRDCFFQRDEKSEIEIIINWELEEELKKENLNHAFGSVNPGTFDEITINDYVDYKKIIKDIKFDNLKKIEPLYIKKPNIC